jgi:hypothetical protein
MHRKLIGLVAVAGVLACLGPAVAKHKGPAPDATLTLKEGSVAAGLGISWGSGTLTYHGKSYPISVDGLSVGAVGVTSVTATGKVYGLHQLSDFDGNFAAVGAGATVGGGGSVATMKNQNGVKVTLTSTTKGVSLSLAAGGVNMKVK